MLCHHFYMHLHGCSLVVPLLPREVTGNLDELMLHSVGVLEVSGAAWINYIVVSCVCTKRDVCDNNGDGGNRCHW